MTNIEVLEHITVLLEGNLDSAITEIIDFVRHSGDQENDILLDSLLDNYYLARRSLEVWEERK